MPAASAQALAMVGRQIEWEVGGEARAGRCIEAYGLRTTVRDIRTGELRPGVQYLVETADGRRWTPALPDPGERAEGAA